MRAEKRPLYHSLLSQQKGCHPHLPGILNIYVLWNSVWFVFTKLTALYSVEPVNHLTLPKILTGFQLWSWRSMFPLPVERNLILHSLFPYTVIGHPRKVLYTDQQNTNWNKQGSMRAKSHLRVSNSLFHSFQKLYIVILTCYQNFSDNSYILIISNSQLLHGVGIQKILPLRHN